ncbi:DUF192 domain-containing protein [Candidatus Roizmanbacteria bacterium]|nr:DUF192 domain-containing protein [Candidatus Roizmanbacteria bacterium]
MRRFLPIVIFLFLIMSLVASFSLKKPQVEDRFKNYKIINYKVQTNPSTQLRTSYKLLVADTSEKWELGLMNISKLQGVDGMIFIFPKREYKTFWNKNTRMDLDVYWIDGENVVGKSFLPSIKKSGEIFTVNSPQEVDKVVELPID